MNGFGDISGVDVVRYRCPACSTLATLTQACPGCGRAADERAERLSTMDASVRVLAHEVRRTRAEFDLAYAAWLDASRARGRLAAAMLATHASEPSVPAGESRIAPAPQRPTVDTPTVNAPPADSALPDASPRTVQNLLFILGGVL